VWLASRVHVDSFADLPEQLAAEFGSVVARVARAILSLGDVGRVHLYRWGDGGAHFHVWLLPRPLGMLEASGMMLPLWEDVLPNVPDEELAAAARRVAAAM
jgi:diadenosine tetraphosphate (Ap4A) HIT family hydrolase